MKCDCKTKIEAELLEKFKAKLPDAEDHSVELQGYGFAIVGSTMELRGYLPIAGGANHKPKTGAVWKWKKHKGMMAFSYCPFCGEKA